MGLSELSPEQLDAVLTLLVELRYATKKTDLLLSNIIDTGLGNREIAKALCSQLRDSAKRTGTILGHIVEMF